MGKIHKNGLKSDFKMKFLIQILMLEQNPLKSVPAKEGFKTKNKNRFPRASGYCALRGA